MPVTCLGARGIRDFGVLFQLRRELKRFGPQIVQTFLFHATVRKNLLYARPGATEAEMIAAAQCANIHATIASPYPIRSSGGHRRGVVRSLFK